MDMLISEEQILHFNFGYSF